MNPHERVLTHLRVLIRKAVEASIGPDTGVLLSGGIDSSTVAAFAPDLPAFTGYYEGEAFDERPYARLAAGKREHHEIEITPQDFLENFDAMMESVEPPFAGPGTFGQFMVARYVAAQGIKTVLSGEGGDELFGGYARLHLVAGVEPPDGYENYTLPDDYPRDLAEALHWEWTVNLPALLRVDGQVTSANGLIASAPMTSESVSEFVLGLPPMQRIGKMLLRQAMAGYVPNQILARRDKRGFPVPFVQWAQGPLREFVKDRIGYVPDPEKPWDRKWWLDLCETSLPVAA